MAKETIVSKAGSVGSMNLDMDYARFKESESAKAYDITFITDDGGTSVSAQNTLGNKFAAFLPAVLPNFKTYKVQMGSTLGLSVSVDVLRSNGTPWFSFSYVEAATPASTYLAFDAAFTTAVSSATPTFIYNVAYQNGYATIFFNQVGLEWYYVSNALNENIYVTQEAIVNGGYLKPIASGTTVNPNTRREELFILSCITDNEPTNITGTAVVAVGVQAGITIPSGLVVGQSYSVYVTGTGVANVDGAWTALCSSPTQITLIGSVFTSAFTGQITIQVGTEAIGSLGVLQYNPQNKAYNYIALGTSKQFNLISKKQPYKLFIEYNYQKCQIYYTETNNEPKAIYYTGAYVPQGLFAGINANGIYDYDTFGRESNLQVTQSGVKIQYVSINEIGGKVSAGNHRYVCRFITASNNKTEVSLPTGLVNIYEPSSVGASNLIYGSAAGTPTSKSVNLKVTGIIPGVFSKIEILDILYLPLGQSVTSIGTYPLLPNQSELNITHTGLETGSYAVDDAELLLITSKYKTAESLTVIDNRMVLSNLTLYEQMDMRAWAQTWKHRIIRKKITDIGTFYGDNTTGVGTTIPFPSNAGYRIGEYQEVANVNTNMTLVVNEVYRFNVVGRRKDSGVYESAFYIDDICISDRPTNTDALGNLVTTPNRRVGTTFSDIEVTETNGTTVDGQDIFVYGVEFSGFDMNFLIGGKPVKEIYDELYIFRNDCIPEIMASGILSRGAKYFFSFINGTNVSGYVSNAQDGQVAVISNWPNDYGSTPTTSSVGNIAAAVPIPVNYGTPLGSPSFANYFPDYMSFFTQDTDLIGDVVGGVINGDKIINYGCPQVRESSVGLGFGSADGKTPWHLNSAVELLNGNGNFSSANFEIIDIEEGYYVPTGGICTFATGETWLKQNTFTLFGGANAGTTVFDVAESYVIKTATTPSSITGLEADTSLRYAQYYRPQTYTADPEQNKYGRFIDTVCYYTGSFIRTADYNTNSFPTGVLEVYSGDAFAQKYFHKIRIPQSTTQNGFVNTDYWVGGGAGLIYFSQPRSNARMVLKVNTNGDRQFPNVDYNWWLSKENPMLPAYDNSYNYWSLAKQAVGYNPDGLVAKLPVRNAYSDLKPQNGLYDGYRAFAPLDFAECDLSFGSLTIVLNINGEMLTLQPHKLLRWFFNTRGELQINNQSTTVVIGDGSVLSRPPITLSNYGTKNRNGVVMGMSIGGKECFYFIDTNNKIIFRWSQEDGTRALSIENNINSFLEANLTMVDGVDTPAWKYGISGVWHQYKMAVLFTARGINTTIPIYDRFAIYQTGDISWLGENDTNGTWDELPAYYIALQPSTGVSFSDSNYWEKLPFDDSRVYNLWTIEFNERKNGFTSFHTPRPKLYMPFRNTYLTADPRSGVKGIDIYEHNAGLRGIWYAKVYADRLEGDAYVTMVLANDSTLIKRMLAVMVNSFVTPKRIDFETKLHKSFLLDTDFENNNSLYTAAVLYDTLTSSTGNINNEDTSQLFGQYVLITFRFENNVFQYLTDFVTKFVPEPRVYTT